MPIIKLKKKIKKSILVCFACFAISPVLFAYDELIEKKYKTFDGKIFEIKENAILHEKVQRKVDMLMEAFKEEMEASRQQEKRDREMHIYLSRYDYGIGKYEEYENCLYVCLKKLEEKGIDVEIKLTQFRGTFTTHRSSNLK